MPQKMPNPPPAYDRPIYSTSYLCTTDSVPEEKPLDAHYSFMYHGVKVDPYRIFEIYGITNGPQQHAIKKLLRAGKSVKSLDQDIAEVIKSLTRWQAMIKEDLR